MFADAERLIFRYEVRGAERYADPLEVAGGLVRATGGRFDQLCREAAEPSAATDAYGNRFDDAPEDPAAAVRREEASGKLHRAVCAAFGIAPFDPATGVGASRSDVAVLLADFNRWLEKNLRPADACPGASESTATPPDSPPTT